ncbi:MAG: (d)CMP kinase [Lentisphaerae bacterium]|nr:(d)CMP kinase [Lentisphaerota bacterium]
MRNGLQIAIDGPSASGKSTVSRRVAQVLGFVYVDSGMFYRTLTWKAVREGVPPGDAEAVVAWMHRCRWELSVADGAVRLALDGVDPGLEIRCEPVRERVSEVAAISEVRAFLVARLRETARFGSLVMEGRDIGTVVFPESPWKFYLDADPDERARRRALELEQMEGHADPSVVRDSLARRDQRDRTRKDAPLQIALNADVIDSTSMSVDEVVALIVARVRAGKGAA